MPPLEFPPESGTVEGIRLNAFQGMNDSVYGLDLGWWINRTKKNFVGSQFSLFFNRNEGRATIIGMQFSFFGNYNAGDTNVVGLQLSFLGNIIRGQKGTVVGLQAGLFNSTYGQVVGGQIGFGNHAANLYGFELGIFNSNSTYWDTSGKELGHRVVGAQIGLFNSAGDVYGFQIGLFNHAVALHGIQIGLVNTNEAGPLKFFPLINVGI